MRAPRSEVFDFLADLENHWRLADRFVEVLALDRGADARARGGRVRMRGPLGVRRTATTLVLAADPPQQMIGIAELARPTRAFVRWKLSGDGGETEVRLEATVDRAGLWDRLLLLLGGRAWLERRFDAVLERLADVFAGVREPSEGGGGRGRRRGTAWSDASPASADELKAGVWAPRPLGSIPRPRVEEP